MNFYFDTVCGGQNVAQISCLGVYRNSALVHDLHVLSFEE